MIWKTKLNAVLLPHKSSQIASVPKTFKTGFEQLFGKSFPLEV